MILFFLFDDIWCIKIYCLKNVITLFTIFKTKYDNLLFIYNTILFIKLMFYYYIYVTGRVYNLDILYYEHALYVISLIIHNDINLYKRALK